MRLRLAAQIHGGTNPFDFPTRCHDRHDPPSRPTPTASPANDDHYDYSDGAKRYKRNLEIHSTRSTRLPGPMLTKLPKVARSRRTLSRPTGSLADSMGQYLDIDSNRITWAWIFSSASPCPLSDSSHEPLRISISA
eukprot:6475552-Pyramimonas_sp.AAC.1